MTRTRRGLVLATAIMGAACSKPARLPAASAVAPQATGADKERADGPTAAPVSRGGVRYEAIVWGRSRGLAQNGGGFAAGGGKKGAAGGGGETLDAAPHHG